MQGDASRGLVRFIALSHEEKQACIYPGFVTASDDY